MNFKPRPTIRYILDILLGVLLLSLIAFYNRYPLVDSDSGTYIHSGFEKFVPNDRPVPYGLFVRVFSFNISPWLVILFQNLITVFVVYETFNSFFKTEKYRPLYYYITICFLTFFTGIGWYSNQIMADFFTPLAILSIFLLLKSDEIHAVKKSIIILILLYSLVVHFSHLLIIGLLVGTCMIIELYKYRNDKLILKSRMKKYPQLILILTAAFLLLPTINYILEKKFISAKSSHSFLMAHLADAGILEKFLKEKCGSEEYKDCKLCYYQDSIPRDLGAFLWDEHGVFMKTGGWLESKKEYNKIIRGTLTDPKFLMLNLYESLRYGFKQLLKNEIGVGLAPRNEGSAPYGQIHWRFHGDLDNYLNSRQNKSDGAELDLKTLNIIHRSLLIISLLTLVYLFAGPWRKKVGKNLSFFVLFVLSAIVINSLVTAGLNSPNDRFQARVVWLLVFAMLMVVFKLMEEGRESTTAK